MNRQRFSKSGRKTLQGVDLSRTLSQIDGQDWGEPLYDSHVIRECHRLRHVPLRELTPEDLRLLVSQQVSLPLVIPLALSVLETNPLAESDFYPGDLLNSLRRVPGAFWVTNPHLYIRWQKVVAAA